MEPMEREEQPAPPLEPGTAPSEAALSPQHAARSLPIQVQRRTRLVPTLFGILLSIPGVSTLVQMLSSARFMVKGDSMEPTLAQDHYVLVSRAAYWFKLPSCGDIVALYDPGEPNMVVIKRIVGLPGEKVDVERGQVFINGGPLEEPYLQQHSRHREDRDGQWSLGEGEYLVLGDNRNDSQDSRSFGPVRRGLIIGRVWLRYWPRQAWGVVRHADQEEQP
ncbi:MAG: signal peptidase I [Dehalococcoidia bacterium]